MRRIPEVETGEDLVGSKIRDLTARIDGLAADLEGPDLTIGVPEPAFPFTVTFHKRKEGVRAEPPFAIPATISALRIWIIASEFTNIDQATWDLNILEDEWNDIEEHEIEAQFIQRPFRHVLDFDKEYQVVRLVGVQGGLNLRNPSQRPIFSDPPLATFTTPAAFGAPSAPALVLILVNRLDPDTEDFDAFLVFRIYAPLTDGGNPQDFASSGVNEVRAVIEQQVAGAEPEQFSYIPSGAELTQVDTAPPDGLGAASPYFNRGYVDVPGRAKAAQQYEWLRNIAFTNGERKVAAGSGVLFYGANLAPGTDGLPELTDFTFTASVKTDVAGAMRAHLELNFRQSTPAIGLRNVRLAWKYQTEPDSAYRPIENSGIKLRDDRFHKPGVLISDPTANGGPITWDGIPVKPKNKTQKDVTFRFNLVSRRGINRNGTVNLDVTVLNPPSDPATALIIANELDPTTKKFDARVVFRVRAPLTDGGAAQTLRQAGIEAVFARVTRVGRKTRKHGGALTSAELDQVDAASTPANRGFVDIEAVMKAGAPYSWDQNIIHAESEVEQSDGAPVLFFAGGMITAAAGIPELTSVSLTRDETAPYDGKHSRLTLNFTQPATPVALRDVLIEIDDGSGFKVKREPISLKKDTFHTSGVKAVVLGEFKTKKLITHTWRATITAEGDPGATRQVSLTQATGQSTDRQQLTSAPATQVSNIQAWWGLSGPRIRGNWSAPAGNKDALRGYYAVFTDNAGTKFMHPNTGASSVTESDHERFVTTEEFAAKLKKGQIHADFAGGVKLKVTPVWLVNDVDTKGTALSSALLTLGNEFLSDARDSVRSVDINVTIVPDVLNLADNGHLSYHRNHVEYGSGLTTELAAWKRRALASWTTGNDITTSMVSGMQWQEADHNLLWQSNAQAFAQGLGAGREPGAPIMIVAAVKSNGTPTVNLQCFLKQNDGTNVTADDLDVLITDPGVSVVLGGTYKTVAWRHFIKSTYDGTKLHISFETPSTIDSLNRIIIDAVMVAPTSSVKAHGPSFRDLQIGSWDITPNATATGGFGDPLEGDAGAPAFGDGRELSF